MQLNQRMTIEGLLKITSNAIPDIQLMAVQKATEGQPPAGMVI